jgi:hypothetical protein
MRLVLCPDVVRGARSCDLSIPEALSGNFISNLHNQPFTVRVSPISRVLVPPGRRAHHARWRKAPSTSRHKSVGRFQIPIQLKAKSNSHAARLRLDCSKPLPRTGSSWGPGAAAICNSQTPSATRPKVKSNSPITTGSQNEQTGQRQILLHVPGAWSALRAGPEGCASLPNPPLRCTVACPRQG